MRGSARKSVCNTSQLAGCVPLTCCRGHGTSSHPTSCTEGGMPSYIVSMHSQEYLKAVRNFTFTQPPHLQLVHCSSTFLLLMGKQTPSFITSSQVPDWSIGQSNKLLHSKTTATTQLLPELSGYRYSHVYEPRATGLNHNCAVSCSIPSCLSTPFPPVGSQDNVAWCDSILKKRRRKMNRHKYKKWRKKTRFLRRSLGK